MKIKGRFYFFLTAVLSTTLLSKNVQARDAYCLQDSWVGVGNIYLTENVMIYEGTGTVKARVERLNNKTYLLNDGDGSTAFRVTQEEFGFTLTRVGNSDPDIVCFNDKSRRTEALEKIMALAEEKEAENIKRDDLRSNMREVLQHNWRIPSSARNGMSAFVQIELHPNGAVDTAEISSSNGDLAFDRSILQAVERVGHFEFIADIDPVEFERNWRKVLVEFRPEGLRW